MKIGLLTIHFANNYGAVLQTYATQRFLSANHDVEIINFIPNTKKAPEIMFCKRFKKAFNNPVKILYNRIRMKKFKKFRQRYYQLSRTTYHGDNQIENSPPQYDVYIAGSDQIWNTEITNNSRTYFLSFVEKSKKISYASSFGHSILTKMELMFVKKYLQNFDFLSVRELESAREIEQIINKNVVNVLDPVFLLDDKQWLEVAKKVNVKKNYILIYSMQFNKAMSNVASIAAKLGYPIYIINGGGTEVAYQGSELLTVGPREFLWLIKNAKLVITNSFHGTAFSLIFQKKFIACEHTTRNLRLFSLLKNINKEGNIVFEGDKIDEIEEFIIDGKDCFKKLDILKSRKYLNDILK